MIKYLEYIIIKINNVSSVLTHGLNPPHKTN